jgi:hypothetical protein
MIRRRAVVTLSLLGALLSCAFAAQSASATPAKNTTAFTCVQVTPNTGDFSDAHCNTKVAEGEYAHQSLGLVKTKVSITNESTPTPVAAILKGTFFGVVIEISCNTLSGEATQSNEEPEAKSHRVSTIGALKLSECTVPKPSKCTVKEPIEMKVEAEGVEGLGAGENEMGIEFKPEGGGKNFAAITFQNKGAESCSFAGKTLNLEGTMIATGGTATQTEEQGGATRIFTNAMTKETLSISGKPAELSATMTVRMAGGGNPISFTTVT